MKYAHIEKETGKLLGWYDSEIHGEFIPPEFEKVITQEELKNEDGEVIQEEIFEYKLIKDSFYNIENIPTPNIEVSEDDWQSAVNINANCYEDGKFIIKDFRTASEILQLEIDKFKKVLTDTDWYVIRYMDEGTEIPEDIKLSRINAREFVRANS